MDSLRNQPWSRLVEKTNTHNHQWKERLALYRYVCGIVSEAEYAIVWNNLTQEQQQLMMFHDELSTTVQLAKNSFMIEVYALVGLHRSILIDLVLGESESCWYAERRAELENTHKFSTKILSQESTQRKQFDRKQFDRKQLYKEARLKTLKMGQLIDGTVSKVKHYGLFVDIGGSYALLHTDNISQAPMDNLEKIFQTGDWIRAVIIDLNVERGRVSLSTKDLESEAGDMLKDPLLVYANAEVMATQYHQNAPIQI